MFRKSAARMVIHGAAKDPTWGPFGQQTSRLEGAASLKAIKAQGGRAITWIEGFGDCMLYAAAFNRKPAGTFEARSDDKDIAKVVRSHWDWAAPDAAAGNTIRWVGIHNTKVDDEDFCQPLNKRLGLLKLLTRPTPMQRLRCGCDRPALGTLLNHKGFQMPVVLRTSMAACMLQLRASCPTSTRAILQPASHMVPSRASIQRFSVKTTSRPFRASRMETRSTVA